MQTDMHYYGTFAMARAAGLHLWAAQTVAQAAEYVDDSGTIAMSLADGAYLEALPTAHHPINAANLDAIDQRTIWIPFHFIPGNEGDTYEESLVCRMDSKIAREMVEHHVTLPNEGFALELIGITAHVYADTFSHYGFSGISSRHNRVAADSIQLDVTNKSTLSYIRKKATEFNEKYVMGQAANFLSQLGHGAVSTYPDRPYLKWSFRYEDAAEQSPERPNPVTFEQACEKLHAMFSTFAEGNDVFREEGARRSFDQIRPAVQKIIAVEGDMKTRINAWQAAASEGALFLNAERAAIPEYSGNFEKDKTIMAEHKCDSITGTNAFGFLRAAKHHRDYVLEELLPKYGINVILRT